MTTPTWPPAAGTPCEQLGRYELLFKIAEGGMGTVHLARMRGRGDFVRLYAIKRLHPHLREVPELTEELLHEAAIAGRIRHPNVVPVFDAVDDGAQTFVVMEYVEGESLSMLLRRILPTGERIPLSIVLRIVDDMLAGLQAAHDLVGDNGERLNVVHRDVSPQNVLVGVDGIARLTDFGIAKAASRPKLTKTGMTKGKIAYMSPEQARGLALDARSDVWAAGVVLWEMLAGEHLYEESEDIAVALALVGTEPRRLRSVRADLPVDLEDAVHSALQREPGDRPVSAADYRDRLRAACASSEIVLASNTEVAAFLNRYSGPSIQARRGRVQESSRPSLADTALLPTQPNPGLGRSIADANMVAPDDRRRQRMGILLGIGLVTACGLGISVAMKSAPAGVAHAASAASTVSEPIALAPSTVPPSSPPASADEPASDPPPAPTATASAIRTRKTRFGGGASPKPSGKRLMPDPYKVSP